ncbi:MAG: acyltransferase [Asticcacaulis sp.]|uniref:acyltransferase family protein n=1 Tax=Asticcacaulis sp. TaxID=1872648 RepID=UPI0039E6BBD8
MTEKTRFHALDGIRGLAAISILLFHYTEHNGLNWFKAAPIAVDLFFILSGFVIMHGYGDRIAQGMAFRHFLWQRLLRLWPLYLIGLILGVVAALVQGVSGGDISMATLSGILILPDFNRLIWTINGGATYGVLFPLNAPSWSLFFEMAVNMAFFAYVAFCRKRDLKILAVVSLVIYAACVLLTRQVNPGWSIDNFWMGFPRVIAEFFLGAVIYEERHRVPDMPAIVPIGLALAVFTGFLFADGRALLPNILILLPALIVTASKMKTGVAFGKVAALLGDLSYPLYIVHVPIYALLYYSLPITDLSAPVRTVGMAVLALAVSFALVRLDRMLRHYLKGLPWRTRGHTGVAG